MMRCKEHQRKVGDLNWEQTVHGIEYKNTRDGGG